MQKRSQIFIDRELQGALAFRVTYYWVLLVWGMFCMLAGFPLLFNWLTPPTDPPTAFEIIQGTWLNFRFPMIASFVMVPFLICDVLRLSHRHVGPIYRLRNSLADLADGKPVPLVKFRKGDMWCDLADQFNCVAARLRAAEANEHLDENSHEALEELESVGS